MPTIADPQACAGSMPEQLPLAYDLPQRSGVQELAQLARAQFSGITGHATSPVQATMRNGPG